MNLETARKGREFIKGILEEGKKYDPESETIYKILIVPAGEDRHGEFLSAYRSRQWEGDEFYSDEGEDLMLVIQFSSKEEDSYNNMRIYSLSEFLEANKHRIEIYTNDFSGYLNDSKK